MRPGFLPSPKVHKYMAIHVFFTFAVWLITFHASGAFWRNLVSRAALIPSSRMTDRNNREISIRPNAKGFYARPIKAMPPLIARALVASEDRFFFYHPGVNPFSIIRAILSGRSGGSSTLTQQLVKVLLGNEGRRTYKNKIRELAYALSLEMRAPKRDILALYANAAYFGNRAQGIEQASRTYYGKSATALTENEIAELIRVIKSPSVYAPKDAITDPVARKAATAFEPESLDIPCDHNCQLTIDMELTEKIREVLRRNLRATAFKEAQNGAVVVLKLPENEILVVIGSPDPSINSRGYKINMAKEPRPIGSTIKPFIYAEGFTKGLRPYTLVDDREYSYPIGTGFTIYPKNYDFRYRGEVTLHYALANSLNVPAVKTLEYIGADTFFDFLTNSMGFRPLQDFRSYELSIALGGLEMDLLTLSHFFSVLPNQGNLRPLTLRRNEPGRFTAPMENLPQTTNVFRPDVVELVNKILSDRQTGVEQFGIASNLNLPFQNYAVKTGTSREFHDSWTIGFTPTFLVGVWIGNADNTPMDQVSGSIGAGKVWAEAMQILYNSPYNDTTPFDFSALREYPTENGIDYGLLGDDVERARLALKNRDTALILEPHNGDEIVLEVHATITLRAKEPVTWFVHGEKIGEETETIFKPQAVGTYKIEAVSATSRKEELFIQIVGE